MESRQVEEYLSSVAHDMRQAGADERQIAAVRASLAEHIEDARREAGPDVPIATILQSIDPPAAFRDAPGAPVIAKVPPRWLGRLSLAIALGVVLVAFGVLPHLAQPVEDRIGPAILVFGEGLAAALGYGSRADPVGRAGLLASVVALLLFLFAAVLS